MTYGKANVYAGPSDYAISAQLEVGRGFGERESGRRGAGERGEPLMPKISKVASCNNHVVKPSAKDRLRQILRDFVQRQLRGRQPPGDPYADRLAPVRRGPKGRSGTAVAEPEDDSYRSFPPRSR